MDSKSLQVAFNFVMDIVLFLLFRLSHLFKKCPCHERNCFIVSLSAVSERRVQCIGFNVVRLSMILLI
ncbi:hypothetical protein Mgra_00010260 [Meloidogyne graminicola]|uniref:Uncharacterized protein n=1 Tax=Meloidogyne graminicola TaxID=189291 RepID=A0A8S9ZAP3_9BILA|nr:hypothetical protein Mgra_00010260 [Meloidogyne graminicola]